jgi:endonuclease/exonuclease/phosphatase family metal-dependent hydrolase
MQRGAAILSLGLVILFIALYQTPIWLKAHRHHSKDNALLLSSPVLIHLAKALDNNDVTTAHDLFAHAEKLHFIKAPDPSFLLKQMQHENEIRLHDSTFLQGEKLSIMSYNVGLLDAQLLGYFDYASTPYLNERRKRLPQLIFERACDVIFLQEVWKEQDVRYFEKIAAKYDYVFFIGPRRYYNDGIITFIKKNLTGHSFAFHAQPFVAQNPLEFFPGPQILRGFHHITINHPNLGIMHLYNSHLLSWPQKWDVRMQQAREIALHAAQDSKTSDLVFIAGDMNSGPYYKNDSWTMPDQTIVRDWWKNTIAYAVFLHYGDLNDLSAMGRSANQASSDVDMAENFIRNNATWCKNTPKIVFTATDCNKLYEKQYKGTEYPARLDYIFSRDLQRRIVVQKSGLAFTNKLLFTPNILIEPSDHYGVFVDLFVKKANGIY